MSILSKPYFHDETAAFAHLESVLWPNGPTCPHCKATDRINRLEGVKDKKGRERIGLWKCYHCRKQFTVRVGTVFESSHVELFKWLQAVHLMACSKKGVSAHQLHRILEVTYKTAWFMAHRIREAMRDGVLSPLGGMGQIVEGDETYFGTKEEVTTRTRHGKPGLSSKRAVLALVERGGSVRTFHIDRADKETVVKIVNENADRESGFYTDESPLYTEVGKGFDRHATVKHTAGEYVRYEFGMVRRIKTVGNVIFVRRAHRAIIHTNTVENVFSVFKRGMKGVYQHCSEKHLHRYLAEFDFRYNHRSALGVEDQERCGKALKGIAGKRLTYGGPSAFPLDNG